MRDEGYVREWVAGWLWLAYLIGSFLEGAWEVLNTPCLIGGDGYLTILIDRYWFSTRYDSLL